MGTPLVVIFHQPLRDGDGSLTALLAQARDVLAASHEGLFSRAGAEVRVVPGRGAGAPGGESFGERLARLAADEVPFGSGLVVLGAGAVPLLTLADARRLVAVALSGRPEAVTNNRFSSDVLALGDAAGLRDLPPLTTDNALPRWLAEHAGIRVGELPGRERLAIDLDTPGDLALLVHIPGAPAALRRIAAESGISLPRLDALRAVAADPRRELLVAGRAGSRTLAFLERGVAARTRFLSEERGLRAATGNARAPRSTLGRLLAARGPAALGELIGELADGAIVDSRVLLADRLGADEASWPAPEDRFASDLLRADAVQDPWLATLTRAAATAPVPILLGAHTLVGPGIRWLLAPRPPGTASLLR